MVASVYQASLRDIEGQWDISRSALDRHKSHVATAIVKAQAQREENSGNSTLEEMRRVQRKAWELLAKAEKKGDNRGAIVALREVRECVESLGQLLARAGGSQELRIVVEHIGRNKPTDGKELPPMPIPAVQQPCIDVVPIPEPAAIKALPVPAGVTLRNGQPVAQSNGVPLRASPLSVNDRPESFKNGFSPSGMVGMSFGRRQEMNSG